MPVKKGLPPPIDRPLSRAYLRKFTGWSTAYPPGVSDPGSLQVIENLLVNREGAVRVRPGLELLAQLPAGWTMVGTHESFYLNDGRKAYLFAARSPSNSRVYFKVGIVTGAAWEVTELAYTGFTYAGWTDVAPPSFSAGTTYVKYVQIDNKVLALSDNGEASILFHVGATKRVVKLATVPDPGWHPGSGSVSRPGIYPPSLDWVLGGQTSMPTPAVNHPDSDTLTWDYPNAPYNIAIAYTFSSEIGETAPSEIGVFRIQRPWGGWSWAPPKATIGTQTSTPGEGSTSIPRDTADRLAIVIPSPIFDVALSAGATKMNFYCMSWSMQASVPVEMQLIGSRDLSGGATYDTHGWFDMNPSHLGMGPTIPVPTIANRDKVNTTAPPTAAQGLVAADRLVLVNDKNAGAVIRWTTNEMGNYLNFAATRGGGYKTLTAGNLQVPATVKLWQNPQSADTITVLCNGTDGYSSSYYMAPASVSSQSDNTQIMGFEETTATPGTVSPFGCEVANNALYHPLDDQLMKSTASNYNINHKSMTDDIANVWKRLRNKKRIVSCFFDQRLYLLVDNADGVALPAGCNGNEVWVLDLASEGGTWSRWLTPGVSLRKVVHNGAEYVSLLTPEGVYIFDPAKTNDDHLVAEVKQTRGIGWKLQTNTQGANRAHDAWAHLRQVSITVGDFSGAMRYGVKGQDLNGRWQTKEKVYRQETHTLGANGSHFDAEDHLAVARDLKEWFFFAESLPGEESFGQLSLVQYRYTPISVNVGYDYGQVETFEYARAVAGAESYTDNGVPQPYLDTSRT